MDERRRHLRVKCRCATEVRPRLPTEDVLLSVAVELSEGGCFVRSNRPLPVGTTLEVDLRLDPDAPLHAQGVVLYGGRASNQSGEPGELGFAVGFTVLDHEATSKLHRYLSDAGVSTNLTTSVKPPIASAPVRKNGNGSNGNGHTNGSGRRGRVRATKH